MGAASRRKGAEGEREVAAAFREGGFPEADRGARLGKSGDDVIRVEGCHIEVKRRERLELWKALEQADKDAPPLMEPVLVFRRNRTPWTAAIGLEFLLELLRQRKRNRELEMALREVMLWGIDNPAFQKHPAIQRLQDLMDG